MIELQKLVDRIEEEFCLKFKGGEDYYYIKRGTSIIDSFNIDGHRGKVDVTVRLTSILDVEIHYVIFYNIQIDEFINRLRRIILATI